MPGTAGYAAVWPCGSPPPLASNLNFAPGQTVAAAVIVAVGDDDSVCFTSNADVALIVDAEGWFGGDSSYHAMTPLRIDDTRG